MNTSEIIGRLPVAYGAIVLSSIFVFIRFSETLPTVMQDEYVYMVQTHLEPVSENEFGNFLHSFLYSFVFLFEDFYLVAKLLNTLFLLLFAFAVLLVARSFVENWIASLIAIGTVLSATSLYASVLMPEMMFFALAAWALAFFVLLTKTEGRKQYIYLFLSVLLAALAGVTKPHALILITGLLVATVLLALLKRQSIRNSAITFLTMLIGYLALKFAIGFVLAGTNGLTLLGANYERSLNSFLEQLFSFNEGALSASAGFINPVEAQGFSTFVLFTLTHFGLLLLAFMFMTLGLPLLLLRPTEKLNDFQLIILVVSVVYLAAIAAFTALVTFSGDIHSDRLLGRYFEFLVPFVFIAALIEISKRQQITTPRKIFLGVGLGVLAIGWLAIISRADFKLSDSGILLGAFREEIIPWAVVGVLGAIMLVIIDRPKKMLTVITLLIVSTVSIIGLSAQQRQIELNSGKVAADFAGEDLRENFEQTPGEQIVVLGTNRQLAFVTKFWSLKANVDHLVLPPETSGSIDDEALDNYSLIVELPGIEVTGGSVLSEGDGYRIIGKPSGP